MARSWYTVAIPRARASRGELKLDLLAFEKVITLGLLVHTRKDLDQRRLAGAIVSQEAGNLTGIDLG